MPRDLEHRRGQDPTSLGRVYWILGAPSPQKTALVAALTSRLAELGRAVTRLRGDRLPEKIGVNTGRDRAGLQTLDRLYGDLCEDLAARGAHVVCETAVAPDETRAWNRRRLPGYVEIEVRVRLGRGADEDRDDPPPSGPAAQRPSALPRHRHRRGRRRDR